MICAPAAKPLARVKVMAVVALPPCITTALPLASAIAMRLSTGTMKSLTRPTNTGASPKAPPSRYTPCST